MTVKELRDLLARATKGPWAAHLSEWGDNRAYGIVDDRNRDIVSIDTSNCYYEGDTGTLEIKDADAAAIVALRNSADAMLDVVEAAQALGLAWDALDRCIEAGFAAEERPDIARSRVIRASNAFRAALAKLEGAG